MTCTGRLVHVILAAGIPVFLAGCATVTVPEDARAVRVDTMNVKGASCEGVGKKGWRYSWRRTPDVIAVRKLAFPLVITCEKPGFEKAVYVVEGEATGPAHADDLGAMVRKGLKAIAEALGEEPPKKDEAILLRIPMEPEDSAPEEAKAAYQRARALAEGRAEAGSAGASSAETKRGKANR